MPSTSNRRKNKKFKRVPKPKQVWQVKLPTRNWLELPSDLMVNIFQRIGLTDILENAQKVCTAWREICKDPALWRVIRMDSFPRPMSKSVCRDICKHVVDRSQGQLVELTIFEFCNYELLEYIVDRSSQLKRLEIVWDFRDLRGAWIEALKKLPLLDTLGLHGKVCHEDVEAAGRHCPLLKTLKLNQEGFGFYEMNDNDVALAIGKNLPQLTHLELIGNGLENTGLEAILDGCSHLESLDLRGCTYLDVNEDLGKRCSQQIKHLKLPNDSLEGYSRGTYRFLAGSDSDDDDDDDYGGFEFGRHFCYDDDDDDDDDDGYDGFDYDDWLDYQYDMSARMASMGMYG